MVLISLDNRDKHALPHLPPSSHVFRTLAGAYTTLQFLAGFFGPWNAGVFLNNLSTKLTFEAIVDTRSGSISFGISFGLWSTLAVLTTSDKLPPAGGATIIRNLVSIGTMHTMTPYSHVKHLFLMGQVLHHLRPIGSVLRLQLDAAPVAVDWELFLDIAGKEECWKTACGSCRSATAGMLVPAQGQRIKTIFFFGPCGPQFTIFLPCLVCWALCPPQVGCRDGGSLPPTPRPEQRGSVCVLLVWASPLLSEAGKSALCGINSSPCRASLGG